MKDNILNKNDIWESVDELRFREKQPKEYRKPLKILVALDYNQMNCFKSFHWMMVLAATIKSFCRMLE